MLNWYLDMFDWDFDDVESGFNHFSIGIWTMLNQNLNHAELGFEHIQLGFE